MTRDNEVDMHSANWTHVDQRYTYGNGYCVSRLVGPRGGLRGYQLHKMQCDCILGPHNHEIGTYPTLKKAETAMGIMVDKNVQPKGWRL